MEDKLLFHESTKQSVWQTLKAVLATNQPHQLIIKPFKQTRSLSQNALFHLWTSEISKYLCANDANYTPEQVKEMLKHTFLGYEVVERIDVTTQQPERVRALRRTSKLDTGEMHVFMQKVECWAIGICCFVTIPESSEYMKLKQEQEN
ncbi:recombination protein NinB [Arsenophonus nasoniae]|uniref:NinB protein n=1 Tax=Arsenophonus nasoniae TaxID=638 RepID=A0A4P7L388_9GAMM|nr:recombination protein NinB [Arsenophonus nasoniae]QBY44428.1 NinB protein [Arsenophonus nasoniae]WGM04687.1 recombination protein NinB [Arsenophonus nasoniae]WGM09801.1 recombination protein NinB [Arsenophonus nasoniae]WGM14520.1 recombination protein NinB [Arsenophonus nasoniae]